MTSPTHEAPYRGLRVLDFGRGVASPYCAMLHAAYGAEVIKVEPPDGDWSRRLGTTYGDHSSLSAVYNRGKRGVLASENPKLIYLSISGFGQTGPHTQRPCSDSVAQAFSGLISVNVGNDGIPHRVNTTISDICTGVYAFQAVATALFARAHVGVGRWIDVNLSQSTAALLGHKLAEQVLEGGTPRALNVPAGCYRTADGWIVITLVTAPQYKRLCAALGREDLAVDPRFIDFGRRADSADALVPQIKDAILREKTEYWLALLRKADIIAERIMTPKDWLDDAHIQSTHASVRQTIPGMGDVYSPRTPGFASLIEDRMCAAPAVGQDSRAVLEHAGFEAAEIGRLIASGAVHAPR